MDEPKMDEPKRDHVSRWLRKSQHDLESARRLAEGDDPLLDTAVYHCQQAAEKAVKAFLVLHDVRVPKTHNLVDLIGEASAFTSDYAAVSKTAKRLTQYATLFRYPDVSLDPTQAEYEQAYHDASQFVAITLALIPAEAHPAS